MCFFLFANGEEVSRRVVLHIANEDEYPRIFFNLVRNITVTLCYESALKAHFSKLDYGPAVSFISRLHYFERHELADCGVPVSILLIARLHPTAMHLNIRINVVNVAVFELYIIAPVQGFL